MQIYRRLLLCSLIQPLTVWAVDLQPNDIVAPLPDKNHAMISYINTDNTTYYKNGSVVSAIPYGSPDVSSQTSILRLVTSYSVKGLPAVSFIQLPYGSIKPGGSLAMYPTATGIGDLTFASAFWPYSDRVNRRYFGVAGYLTLPTGSYNSQQPFNTGENRSRSDIQMGYQQPIIGNLDGMVAVDTMWFGVIVNALPHAV